MSQQQYTAKFTKKQLRKAFEAVIGQPPFECELGRKINGHSGNPYYVDPNTDLAWIVLGETLKLLLQQG